MSTTDEDELRLLYQTTVTDLSYFKTQQWNVSYYVSLIQAALVGIAKLLLPKLSLADRSILGILAVLASIVALTVLGKLQRSISVRQSRLDAVRETFGSQFQRAWAAEHKQEDRLQSIYFLRGGVVLTTLLTLWLVTTRLVGTS